MMLATPEIGQFPWTALQTAGGQKSVESSQTQVMASSEERHLEMDLVTAEGDKVTLSIDSQSKSLMAGYTEAGSNADGTYSRQGFLMASEQERSMTLTVEGDLNEQEMRDIRKVMKTLKRMMNNFVNDRLKPMMANAKRLKNLDTVAGLEVEMSYSRQFLVAEQTQIDTTYNQQGALAAPPAAETGALSQPAEPAAQFQDPFADAAAQADALTDAMAAQMQSVRDFIDRMQSAVSQLFDDVRSRIEAFDPEEPAGPALIDQMQQDLMAKTLSEQAEQTAAEQTA